MHALIWMAIGGALVWLLLLARTHVASFRAQPAAQYAGLTPVFDPAVHLCGPILCEGVIFGPTGRVSSRFVADMLGSWNGPAGILAETFRYDSGAVQHRQWTLTVHAKGRIEATAPDVIGIATGKVSGSGIMMRYRIKLPPESGGHVLNAVDWMYLVENGTILNRSQFFKFGILVAELVATLRRADR
jgi:Protein of unknown function (DUF3833)